MSKNVIALVFECSVTRSNRIRFPWRNCEIQNASEMQMSEQTDLPSEGLTTKKDLSIKVENTTPTIEGKSIPESLWGQLEELEKAESLSQTHVDSFQRKRKKEEFTVETLEEGSVEESPTKSPHKSTGVTPKLESLSLSKNENRLKRLEECDLASLIEEELSRQQFLLDSLKSEESTKDLASIQQQVNAPEDEECDSYSGCDINEWVTGCQCNKCHKNVACVGCGKKGCSNCLDCCGECGSYVCGNDVVREVEGCSLQCGIHRRLFCPNCVGFCDSCLEVVCPNDLTICSGCDERYCSRCNDCPNCI